MTLSPDDFRSVMGRLAGGVVVVTGRGAAGEPRGLTATAVCSVSLSPPLVLVCVANRSQTLAAIGETGRYAINVLSSEGIEDSRRFASADERKFDGVGWTPAPGGSPLLPGLLAWVECDVERTIEAGDHTVFIGRVTDGRVEREGADPLVHFDGSYRLVGGEPA